MHLTVGELLRYTSEERERWEQWFRDNTEDLLKVPIQRDRGTTIGGCCCTFSDWSYGSRSG
jgi:hypothetical protein